LNSSGVRSVNLFIPRVKFWKDFHFHMI
jgi:hypothetical protein